MKPYLEQLEAVAAAVKHGKGGIVMPTGSGKSITMALLIHAMQLRTLVVVPNLELKKQLSETFTNIFGSLDNIAIENIDSPRLQTLTDFDVLILDECHKSASASYQKLNKKQWVNIYHRFFFTATFFRNQENEQLLFEGICGQVIYQLSHDKAVKNKLIVPLEAYYIESPRQSTEAYTYQQVYSELVVNNQAKNELIAGLLLNLKESGTACLCLVKEIAHGEALAALTGLPFANGQDEGSRQYIRQFTSGGYKVLIATEGVAGEGLDTKICEFVIIAGSGKAKSSLMQKIGRCLRVYPGKESGKVILIKDRSHKFLTRHFKAQCDILLAEYGIKPTKLEL